MANKAIFLAGPTAVGKTELALRLAQRFPLEIISVDSALIYRDLDIGSAKPTLAEMAQVPHHLIDILSPLENYSVAEFLQDCNQAISEINQRGKLPLLVGGTMMYYNALVNGISQLPAANPELRAQLSDELVRYGNAVLHQRLLELDPISAAKIEINDTQRLQRALEVCLLTGKPMSLVQQETKQAGLVNCQSLPLAIVPQDREIIHQRINSRFIKMLENGFIQEVQSLQHKYPQLTGDHNSMRSVGYRQVWQYLAGEFDLNELTLQGQAATRQLAKRQITWLRSLPLIKIDNDKLDLDKFELQLIEKINQFLNP